MGKMRSKEGSKGCHQRDILSPNDTTQRPEEHRDKWIDCPTTDQMLGEEKDK